MSDSDENISDSSDSDSCDEWQDYFSDPEDSVLDDNTLPPVIINTVKYKIDQCLICFEDLDTEIGSPDTCVHMYCFKCISLWAKISKTCPQDGRKFSSILKFVMREGNVMFLHENGAKISCGRPDMLQSHQRPQSPQNPNNIDIPLYVPNRRNMDVFSPPEPIWRWRRQKYVPSPAGRWNQEQRLKYSSTSLNPGSRRKTTPPGIEKQNPQWQWCKRNQWIKFGWMRFGGICFCEMCLSSSQGLPSSSDLEMMERRSSSSSTSYQDPSLEEETFGMKNFRKFRGRRCANHEFLQVLSQPQTSRISQNPSRIHRNRNRRPIIIPSEVD